MNTTTFGITIKFHPAQDHTYQVDLTGPQGQQYGGQFILPYDPPTWTTILRALEPDFTLDRADDDIRAALQPLGDLGRLPQTIGQALAEGLLADPDLLAGFNVALRQAEEARQPLPVTFDGARYHYHTLLRQYAYAELEKQGDPRPVHRLAAEYLQAKRTSDEGGTPEEALEEVDQWAQAEDWEQFARRASALVGSLDRIGYWAEIQERLERALAAVREHRDDPRQEAALLNDLGAIASKRAEWDRAIEMFKLCLETKERMGDVHGMAQTWGNLGIVYLQKGEWDRVIEMYEQSLETFERVGDVHGMAQVWGNLGSVYLQKGEWDRAIEMYEQSLETFDRVADVHGMSQTFNNLGIVYLQKGEWDRAIEMFKLCLETKERVGDVHGMAQTWGNLGLVYADKGEWERAIEMYQQSLETKERVGDVHGMAQTWGNLGYLYQAQGDTERAAHFAAHAYLVFAQLGAAPEAQQAGRQMVDILGSPDEANAYLAQLQAQEDEEPE